MNNEQLKRVLIGLMPDEEIPPQYLVVGAWQFNGREMTMIGYPRLTNLEELITDVVKNNIKGHVIETGVWKGGACILMREVLNKLGSNKKVYVADSFEGLPIPDEKYLFDKDDYHYKLDFLSVSLKEVKRNFALWSTLENVVFVKGWFKNTLHKLKTRFSLIRLDGDMYESTMDALVSLYPRLSVGGYCIIDDMGAIVSCNHAVQDYRKEHNITEEMINIDGAAIYWKKER